MVKIRTLNELLQLKNSEFNQPFPRHGINLLFWFAQNSDHLNPSTGEYGFHRFYNRIDDDDEDRLLPDQNVRYYEVGNLNAEGADKLPVYVRQKNAPRYYGDSNKDRIIVRVNQRRIDRVYVTEHEDQKNFSNDKTYRVSLGLLEKISGMSRDQFLKSMQRSQLIHQSQQNFQNQQESESGWSWCTIL